jgi:6-phosphofructokinase 1
MKSFCLLTSGGDAPGMNAAIRAVVRMGLARGMSVFGAWHGFDGLIEGEIEPLTSLHVGGIIGRGGTVLRSARSERFRTPEGRSQAAENLRHRSCEGLVVIGGDGSLRGAREFHEETGIAVIGIPASIDNDIPCTTASIGFDTAVNTALDAIDRIRDTAYSHERVFVIEVMGRRNGFIAVEAGLAGGAEAVLIPEMPFDLQEVADNLISGHGKGKRSSIIIVAEGAASAVDVTEYLRRATGYEVRYLVLGHMQRGGNPTAFDRVLATRLGARAVEALASGENCHMTCFQKDQIGTVPLSEVFQEERQIDARKLLLSQVMAQ